MSVTQDPFKDRDEQAAWELLGQHRSIEPSFGFAARTLRRLEESPARPSWWQMPALRWALSLSLLALIAGAGMLRWERAQATRRVEIYAAAQQDSLDDYDVIAALDQLNGGDKL